MRIAGWCVALLGLAMPTGSIGVSRATEPSVATPMPRNRPPRISDPRDVPILEAFVANLLAAAEDAPERMARFAAQPEDLAWRGAKYLRMPLVAYRLTGQPKYLDLFVDRMDALCGCLTKGPDGLLGWYGKPSETFRDPEHPNRKVDGQLASFAVAGVMAEFARIVQADPALKSEHGESERYYLSLAEHLVKKWDARRNYRDLGRQGAIYKTEAGLHPLHADLTQPHSRHGLIVASLLPLYEATRNDEYLLKAIKLGMRFKRCLTLVEDHYRWDYWSPTGPWDMDPQDPSRWKQPIGVESRGASYAASVAQAVWLYEYGLVFNRTDMERFAKTQIDVCWNGDVRHPRWSRVDGEASDTPMLYWGLVPFAPQLRPLAFGGAAQLEQLGYRDSASGGGASTGDWLEAKLLLCPAWGGDEPAEAHRTAAFRQKPDNEAQLKELAHEITTRNYLAPQTPMEMGFSAEPR